MRVLAALLLATLALNAQKVIYTKSFPNSNPAYVSIEVARDGAAVFKESPTDAQPVKFQMSATDVAQIFALADKLDHFKRTLESGLKVAFMGESLL